MSEADYAQSFHYAAIHLSKNKQKLDQVNAKIPLIFHPIQKVPFSIGVVLQTFFR